MIRYHLAPVDLSLIQNRYAFESEIITFLRQVLQKSSSLYHRENMIFKNLPRFKYNSHE
jgi:hypothetical protein